MKILLTSKLPYIPALSGASKADRRLLESLADRGHSCRAIILANALALSEERAKSVVEPHQGIVTSAVAEDTDEFQHNGVEVLAVGDPRRLCAELAEQIRRFKPDWTLVSEDRSWLCLATALEAEPARVIYLCHSQATLPFGPECFEADPAKTALLGQVAGIITVSHYLANYIKKWSGLEAFVIPFPVYGDGPFERYGNFDAGFVTIVNPSSIKGITIFLQLARSRPDVRFAAVPTWATSQFDRLALARLPNVQLLEPKENIDDIFRQTRVLVVPSLWGEAFGYLVVEAMLRGIPVLASNIGGLPEAKLGTDYLLPVRPIERYENRLDERLLPVPVVPEQDIEPWLAALGELIADRATYTRVAAASREAALSYVAGLDATRFEDCLKDFRSNRAALTCGPQRQAKQSAVSDFSDRLNDLSAERLELLALFLKSSQSNLTG